ncbi:MAG TPA: helix-turn-helix domain-containing protein [Gemmatimonadaceae bacterium]|nr:helix-turn-helix domain-containing protein [Gemmatimonadaceae bacterium]
MSPRPYRMGVRQAAAEETRARIVAAARAMLAAPGGIGAFTVDAVAKEAGVARMTVYYQFGSKTGLIEAVFDSLAIVRTGVPRLVAALALPEPADTLAEFVRTFAAVWQEDRLVIRRLQGLAALDPEFSRVWHAREGRRREGMREIATRVAAGRGRGRGRTRPRALDVDTATAALYAVVAFETFDAMAGAERAFEDVAPIVHQLARKTLGLDGGEPVALAPARRAVGKKKTTRRRGAGR